MTPAAYYNEIDPFAAQWLRNLISGGHIAPGEVDERSIEDVTPNDLRGFTQCHFFAGNRKKWRCSMNRASPVDLRKSLEIANHLAHIGIRFVPIPVATEEEFQTLAAELSRRLEQMAVEAEKNEGGAA